MLYLYTSIIGTKTRRTNYRDTEVQGQQKTGVCRKDITSESAVTFLRADLWLHSHITERCKTMVGQISLPGLEDAARKHMSDN